MKGLKSHDVESVGGPQKQRAVDFWGDLGAWQVSMFFLGGRGFFTGFFRFFSGLMWFVFLKIRLVLGNPPNSQARGFDKPPLYKAGRK